MRWLEWLVGKPDPVEEVRRLLTRTIPEVGRGVVQIRAIGRAPGVLTKVAVDSIDPAVDAIGACVGVRAARIQHVVAALQGERVDLIPWKSDPESFVKFAVLPLEIVTLSIEGPLKRASVVVRAPDPAKWPPPVDAIQFTASQLTGLQLDIRIEGAA